MIFIVHFVAAPFFAVHVISISYQYGIMQRFFNCYKE